LEEQKRLDRDKQCVLVIVGADALGNTKDIIAIVDGYRARKARRSCCWTSSVGNWRSAPNGSSFR